MKKLLSVVLSVVLVATTVVTCFTFNASAEVTPVDDYVQDFEGGRPTFVDIKDYDGTAGTWYYLNADAGSQEAIKHNKQSESNHDLFLNSSSAAETYGKDRIGFGTGVLLQKNTTYQFSYDFWGSAAAFTMLQKETPGGIEVSTGDNLWGHAYNNINRSQAGVTQIRYDQPIENKGEGNKTTTFTFNTGDKPFVYFAFIGFNWNAYITEVDNIKFEKVGYAANDEVVDGLDDDTKYEERVDASATAGAPTSDTWFGINGGQHVSVTVEDEGGYKGDYFSLFSNGDNRVVGRATLLNKNTKYKFSLWYKNGSDKAQYFKAALYNEMCNIPTGATPFNGVLQTISTKDSATSKEVYASSPWSPDSADWSEIAFEFETGDFPYFVWAINIGVGARICIDELSVTEALGDTITETMDNVPSEWDVVDTETGATITKNKSFFTLNGGTPAPIQGTEGGYKDGYLTVNSAGDNRCWGRVFKVNKDTHYNFSMWFKGNHQTARIIGLKTLANGVPVATACNGAVKTLGYNGTDSVKYYDYGDWGPKANDWKEITFDFNSGEYEYLVIGFTIVVDQSASYDNIVISKVIENVDIKVLSNGVESTDAGNVSYGTISYGKEATFTAVPEVGCEFLGWFKDADAEPISTELTYKSVVDENFSLIAKFSGDKNYFKGGSFEDAAILDIGNQTYKTPTNNGWYTSTNSASVPGWGASVVSEGAKNGNNCLKLGYNWGHGLSRVIEVEGGKAYKIGFWMKATDKDTKLRKFSVFNSAEKLSISNGGNSAGTSLDGESTELLREEWVATAADTWEYKEFTVTTEEGKNYLTLNWDGQFDPASQNIYLDDIRVSESSAGDIDGSGEVEDKDVQLFREYIAGWDVTVNKAALDVNRDGKVDYKDIDIIARYLAGWDVKL